MTAFDPGRFRADIHTTAATIDAPLAPAVTDTVLAAYADNFADGATVWETTSLPGDQLSYRFFARHRADTITQAIEAGLLDPAHPLLPLVASWSGLYGGSPIQCCGFDAGQGLAQTGILLGGLRPAEDILTADHVPESIQAHLPALARLGFHHIRFAAVDWRRHTANVYFRAQKPLTRAQCTRIHSLTGGAYPDGELVDEMIVCLPADYCIAVTFSLTDGHPQRFCLYTPRVPADRLPRVPARIAAFLTKAPSLDEEECTVIGWSFGPAGNYIKAERSYAGDMIDVLTTSNRFLFGEQGHDMELRAK